MNKTPQATQAPQAPKMLIPIQSSCVQQRTLSSGGKLDWQVFDSEGIEVYTLSSEISDNMIPGIQKYVKKFELNAFNEGINFMKEKKNKEIKELEDKYQTIIQEMRFENNKIANKLHNLIGLSLEDSSDEDSKIGIPEHMR